MTEHPSSGEKLIEINGVELCVETFGQPANPAVLLIGGAAASMLWWEAELCQRIATSHYAIDVDGPTRGGFGDITAPTLVVHGDRDPVLPLPHGEALRDAVPGAKLLILEGAGHDLPRPLWDEFVSALVRHTAGRPVMTRTGDLFDYDAELCRHNEWFRAAADVRPHDRVLDIGCGTGQSTREAARAAVAGSALGVDISTRMLHHARRLSAKENLRNVAYLQADAQVHRFPSARFDLCISRFGTMFFTDPVTA
ncbi:MAG: methyltransferase domain-containing protein, partial [Pseudonocardiaceae bacterium]